MSLEKNTLQQGYPLAPATVMTRSDEESTTHFQSEQLMKKKKRLKCFAYIAVLLVFQAIIILVLALTLLRVRTPKVRLEDVTIDRDVNGNIRFNARVFVRNRNYGRYEFDSTVATIKSGDVIAGKFLIPEARAKPRSTKKLSVIADWSSSNVNLNALPVTVEAKLRGKVKLLKVIERKKSADLNCSMTINLSTNSVEDLRC